MSDVGFKPGDIVEVSSRRYHLREYFAKTDNWHATDLDNNHGCEISEPFLKEFGVERLRCVVHSVTYSQTGSCAGCVLDAQYLDEYVRMQRDELRPARPWLRGFQRELASAEWSRRLREKVHASAAAARDRELHQVVIDYFDD
jgi:hypothetical protein